LNREYLTSTTGIYNSIDKLEIKIIKLPGVKPLLNFPDLTRWGV